ncbi:PAS domain-containing sensor histidine kinase [Streptomyces sp. 2A115]|uniref:PAS domain-containing sensor histidine kinase n=1 Tax=Streptomyces sp. 2A115 TaxID=3457439 RepID=UPI003FD63AB9
MLVDSDLVALMNASDVCTIVHDAKTKRILWANPAACAMLEFSLDEILPLRANHISSAAQQYDRIVARAWLQEAIDKGTSRLEWRLRSKSGRLIPTDAVAVRVELAEGPAVMVQYRDIERERQSEADQRLAESYVETLTRHTSTVAFMLDATGVIRSATDTALGYLGLTGNSGLPGRPLASYADLRVRGESAPWADVVAGTDPIVPVGLEIKQPDSHPVWLEGSVERLPEQQADASYLMIMHDVSDRVRGDALRELEQHRENYLARYNVMGDMAMAIAHELGQPLAAAGNFIAGIQAHTEVLAANGRLAAEDGGPLEYGLESVSRQIERAATIVNTLRAFVGHLEHVEQVVELNDVITECLPFIRLRAEPAGVRVKLDLADHPVPVRCERVLTGQVVLNLCFNAIEEMAECEASSRQIELRTGSRGGEGVFTVADRGRGLRRDPFTESFTEKPGGSGIGLALSHRIITRQHGGIWSEHRDGGGSTFGFALPLSITT